MIETCVKFETFWNFWMRGNKMTFPFSGEFKFKLLKATREDDMTSSTINNLNGDVCIWILLHFHSFSSCKKCREIHSKERRNMTLKPTGILRVIWTLKLRGSFENYLQKKMGKSFYSLSFKSFKKFQISLKFQSLNQTNNHSNNYFNIPKFGMLQTYHT